MPKNQTEKIITLDIFYDSITANLAKSKLELNGIKAFLENENNLGLAPLGEIKLKIFIQDLKDAFEILSQ